MTQVTVPCPTCCKKPGPGTPTGCPPGATCRVDPKGPHDEPDTHNCVTSANYGLVFQSKSGSACLCGLPEFTDPSDPPKKYKRLRNSGHIFICGYGGSACATGFGLTDSYPWEDADDIIFDASSGTCDANTHFARHYVDTGATTCGFSTAGTLATFTYTAGPTGPAHEALPGGEGFFDRTRLTFKETYGLNVCQPSSPYYVTTWGSHIQTLSEEDTPTDALARSTPIEGSASSAVISSFDVGTYCFTGQTSHWIANFVGLNPDCGYRFTVTYSRDTEDGGTEILTEETDFTPSGPEYVLEGDVPAVVEFNTQFAGSTLQFLP